MLEAFVESERDDLFRAGCFSDDGAQQRRTSHVQLATAQIDHDVDRAIEGLRGSGRLDGVTRRDRLGIRSNAVGREQVDLGVAALEPGTPSGDSDDVNSIDTNADATSRIA